MNNMKLIIMWIVLFLFLILWINSFVKIDTWYVWVKSTFGKYDMEELQPWLSMIKPFITKVYKIDTKIQNISYKWNWNYRDNNDSNDSIMYKPAITVLDNRWLPIEIELSVLYKVIPDSAAEVLAKYWKNYRNKIINPLVREVVRNVIGEYDAESLPSKRAEIATKIKNQIENKMKSLKYFELNDVQFRNIELPKQIQQKIMQVQEAKQEAERQKILFQKAKIEDETAKTRVKWIADVKIE